MKEIIESIKEIDNGSHMDGYYVKTNKRDIRLLIDNGQSCCENWGHMSSEDNLQSFIGSELISVNQVDNALNVIEVKLENNYADSTECIFLNIETSKGTLQFVVYNSHNGYYSHSVKIQIGDKIERMFI